MLSAQQQTLAKLDVVQNMEAVVLALSFVESGTAQAPAMQKQSVDNMQRQGTRNAPSMSVVRHLDSVEQQQSFAAMAVKMAVATSNGHLGQEPALVLGQSATMKHGRMGANATRSPRKISMPISGLI
jgi:hypothetical protein